MLVITVCPVLFATGDLLDQAIDGGDTSKLASEVKMQKVLELSASLRDKGKEQEAREVDSLALLLQGNHSNTDQSNTELEGILPCPLYCALTHITVLCFDYLTVL